MKIHFDASGRGFDEFGKYYKKIDDVIKELGHQSTNNMFDSSVVQQFYDGPHEKRVRRYKNLMTSLKQSDLVVLEVSIHSLSMGFWMQKALELNKPVIALHLKEYDPSFLQGIDNEKLQLIEYEEENLEEVLRYAIDFASDQQDTRFNFFISPKHQNYLDWISQNRKIPRSVFLRRLIEKHMEENEEYNE
ncbi:MAG: hypothetical protein XD95_0535 [Microgenomates bacterium 39_7]|nr:MAG: hypothetical protein XD95_0535 [Microgenomates bacterium 39_7]